MVSSRSIHISLSLSLFLSLSFLLSFFCLHRLCLLLLTRATTTKRFDWIEILNLNSHFLAQRDGFKQGGFELERISIVKSFVCPCSFSRDDDSSFWRDDDGYVALFSRAKGRRRSAFCSLCVYARVCCCIHQFSLQFLNSLTKL